MRRSFAHGGSPSNRWWFVAGVVVLTFVTILVVPLVVLHSSTHATRAEASPALAVPTTSHPTSTIATTTTTTVPPNGIALDPSWPKTLTLVTDSVTLGAVDELRTALPDWHVEVLGKPALMVKQAVPNYLPPGKRVGSVAVVGLGYNSLWEHDRKNFSTWAAQFDREAEQLIADLRARGAKKIVWVTLREPSLSVVTPDGAYQWRHYAWFFPYVNERLHALQKRQPDVALADWATVSNRLGLTYDLIHLDPRGARLMAHQIVAAVGAHEKSAATP